MNSRFSRKDFLEALFGEYVSKWDGFVRVMTVRQYDRKVSTRYFPKLETLAKEHYPENQHVFFGVCPHESMRADKSSVRNMVALWAGLDLTPDGFSGNSLYFKDMSYAAKAVRSFPLPPSIVVESGWGVHLYWLLKTVTEIHDLQGIQKLLTSINAYFQCTKTIALDSVLRLPDTFNPKQEAATVKCAVKYLNTEFRYDLADFERLTLLSNDPDASPLAEQPERRVVVQGAEDLAVPEEYPPPQEETGVPHAVSFAARQSAQSGGVASIHRGSLGTAPTETPVTPSGSPVRLRNVPQQVAVDIEEVDDAETIVVMAEGSSDSIADEIVEKVVQRLTNELMDKLVDVIVERLYQRITDSTGHK